MRRFLFVPTLCATLVASIAPTTAFANVTQSTAGWVPAEGPVVSSGSGSGSSTGSTSVSTSGSSSTSTSTSGSGHDKTTTTVSPAPPRLSDFPQIDPRPPLSIFPTKSEDRLIDPRMARSWGELPSRPFVASTVDIGFVYLRPRVSFGYGKPYTKWIGVDANPTITGDVGALYGGLRVELPYVDFRAGPRYAVSFNRSYLPQKASYDRLDISTSQGVQQKILTYEAELDSQIPAGPGAIVLRGTVSYVTNVPAGQYAFEETLKIVVAPPFVLRGRTGYLLRLGAYGQHSVGIVGDVLDVPKRDNAVTFRAGPVVRIALSRRVELRGSFVMLIAGPDQIGLDGSDFTELGVRYRWASE